MKKRILQLMETTNFVVIILLIGLVGKMYAYDFSAVCSTGQTLYYNITDASNHYVELTCPYYNSGWWGYTKPTGEIVLPKTVRHNGVNYSVTSIGSHAFNLCNELTGSPIIPNTVTNIGYMAFSGCTGFTGSLSIPNSVVSIDSWAFENCSGFTDTLIIPSSVISIRGSAFRNCCGIEAILVDAGNAVYDSRGNCNAIINTRTNELVLGCKNTIIPNNITSIGPYAFSGCIGLTGGLTIPNTVTMIGEAAFLDCNGLTGELNIPNLVTSIGSEAFRDCNGLTSIIIPSSVTIIGRGAFDGTTWYNNQNDGILYLSNCCLGYKGQQPMGQLHFREGTRLICETAFYYCQGISSISFPVSVNSINYGAFMNCSGLTSIIMFGNTPPSLYLSSTGSVNENNVFRGTNNCPIYVPYESLNAYKTVTNWTTYANRIFPMAYTTISGYGSGSDNWCFIASPLVDDITLTSVDNMMNDTEYDLYLFDQTENAEWRNYKDNNFNLVNGQGYLYANAEDVNLIFKGEFNEDETKNVELVYDADASFAGWNLVGNPFPVSAYANKSYYTMNEDGSAIEPVAVSMETAIPSCTGIMVKAENTGESVTFSKTAPETAVNQGVLQIVLSQLNPESVEGSKGGVSTGSTTALDKAVVSFNAVDRLEKFVFNMDNAKLYIPQSDKDLAIACAKKEGELPLNFKATKNGEYTITIHPEVVELDYLHLVDNLTGVDVDLLVTPAYTFTAKTSDYASRFKLVFSVCEDADDDNENFAFVTNKDIIITGEGIAQVIDMRGRVIVSVDEGTRCISTVGMTPGVYVLRLLDRNDVKTQKIVIQ